MQDLPLGVRHVRPSGRKDSLAEDGVPLALPSYSGWEKSMFSICVETVGDVAVVQCSGRLVRSEAAFELRDAVMSQRDARIVVVDLSEVKAIEGGGLGMLGYVHRWAHDHDIKMKLFNPPRAVQDRLAHSWIPPLEIVSTDEMIALLGGGGRSVTRHQGDPAFC
jgi:anti-anti-sigma regulatory factor